MLQTMTLELVPAKREHVPEIGRIAYEAFKQVAESHGFVADFPSVEIACNVLAMLVDGEDFYGVVALSDGRPVGSNFLTLGGAVAGIGPLTVDCTVQSQGTGRALMHDVLDYARRQGISQIRLTQDSYNLTSLALYTSLGFDVKEGIAWMRCPSGLTSSAGVARPASKADLPAMEALALHVHKTSRGKEIATSLRLGVPAFVREREGELLAYLIPGEFGHGSARTEEDALAVIQEAGRSLPPHQASFMCPLRQTDLFRRSLQEGSRILRVLNYMAKGPYDPAVSVWMPSVLY